MLAVSSEQEDEFGNTSFSFFSSNMDYEKWKLSHWFRNPQNHSFIGTSLEDDLHAGLSIATDWVSFRFSEELPVFVRATEVQIKEWNERSPSLQVIPLLMETQGKDRVFRISSFFHYGYEEKAYVVETIFRFFSGHKVKFIFDN